MSQASGKAGATECEQRLEQVLQYCQQIKQVLDDSPRDCYEYQEAADLLSRVQMQLHDVRPECGQHERVTAFAQQLLALYTCMAEWYADLLQKTRQPSTPFNRAQLRVVEAALFHF